MLRFRQSREARQAACADAAAIDGVCQAEANAVTGSLLIRYDHARLSPAELWAALSERGVVSGAPPITDRGGITRLALSQSKSNDGEFLGAVGRFAAEKLLERFATALIGALI